MKKYLTLFFITLSVHVFAQKEYYELRKYDIPFNAAEASLHHYLETAFIPALNRLGINDIGVFEAYGAPTPKQVFLLIPFKNLAAYEQAIQELPKDSVYLNARKSYDALPPTQKVYDRFTTSFLVAFEGFPKLIKPNFNANLFELRTYEGANEYAVQRKVKMFNTEEFAIFEATGLHSVFFGEQLSGPLMPALTYLLAFESMEERDANWAKFSVHPEWKRVSALKEYANSVSDIKRTFLKPLSYSQL